MGSNRDGKLGIDKQTTSLSKPQLIDFPPQTQIKQISCGWGHSLALDTAGAVFSWGYGKNGALGQGSFSNCYKPSKVHVSDSPVLAVECGSQHSGFLTQAGKVLMCGANHNGQLGIGSREDQSVATLVEGLDAPVEQISLGVTHTLILTQNKEVFSTGGNSFGQLGLGHKQTMETPQKLQDLGRIRKVACGQHSGAISANGELYLWGTGTFGIHLAPHKVATREMPRAAELDIGGSFGVALDLAGRLWVWGANTSGELGVGSYVPKGTPTVVEGKEVAQVYCGSAYVFAVPKKGVHQRYRSRASPAPGQFRSKEMSEEVYSDLNSKDNSKFSSPYNKDEPAISTIKGEKNSYEMDSAKGREERDKLEADLRAALKELGEAKRELANLKHDKSAAVASLEKEKHELAAKLNGLESKYDRDSDAFIKLQLTLNDREIELKSVKTEAELARQNFDSLRAEYSRVLESVQSEKRDSTQLLEKAEAFDRELQRVSKIRTSLENRNAELEKLNNEKDAEYFLCAYHRLRKVKNDLGRVFSELAELQSKYESIKKYTDEVKQNLDAARKENHENILKIEELIKEKIQLANELNQAAHYNEKYDEEIKADTMENDKENRDSNAFDITPVFCRASQAESCKSEIDEKLQGILAKCTFPCTE